MGLSEEHNPPFRGDGTHERSEWEGVVGAPDLAHLVGMDHPGRNARALRKRMTPAELRLWQHIRGGQWSTRFRRQEPLGAYVVDFISRTKRIVIELDGDGHHEYNHYSYHSYPRYRFCW